MVICNGNGGFKQFPLGAEGQTVEHRFIISDFMSESYEVVRIFGCVNHTKRAANPVRNPMIPKFSPDCSPILTSLALAFSGCTILLKNDKIKLVPVVGLGQIFQLPQSPG